MLKSTAVLCVLSIVLCFNLNYTFPYNRGNYKWNIFHGNQSNYCEKSTIVDSSKKMASITENTLKIVESTVPTESSQRRTNVNRASASGNKEEDLSHYEQMVIMKKNPYLDLKELEMKLYGPGPGPEGKVVRASVAGGAARGDAVGICDEGPYVEIVNRGLTGFAIPTKLIKSPGAGSLGEGKPAAVAASVPASASAPAPALVPPAPTHVADDVIVMISKKTEKEGKLLNNLVKDIMKFEENKLLLF